METRSFSSIVLFAISALAIPAGLMLLSYQADQLFDLADSVRDSKMG